MIGKNSLYKGSASYEHEKGVSDFLKQLSQKGWKTINLKRKSPDGIAIKNNEIVAVEVITYKSNKTRYNRGNKARQKKEDYFMFDDVFVKFINRNKEV